MNRLPAAWRVTYAGPQAHWRCPSFAVGAAFVGTIAEAAADEDVVPDVDLRPEGVSVQIRAPDSITDRDRAFAVAVQHRAAALGLVAAPELVQTVSLAVAQSDGCDVRPFWNAVLGYESAGSNGAHDALRRGPFLSFQRIARSGQGRTHVDVSVPTDIAQLRVSAALSAGGRLAVDRSAPEWWGVASPDNHGIDIVAWPDAPDRKY